MCVSGSNKYGRQRIAHRQLVDGTHQARTSLVVPRRASRGLSPTMIAYEILLMAAANAIIDTIIVLVILSKRTERMMGVTKVEQGGVTIYAPNGPDGEPIQVPIGLKEVEGVQTPVMGYAPLGYTLSFLAAEMAAQKVKMGLLGVKSSLSKKMGGAAMQAVADGAVSGEDIIQFLPKKWQPAIIALRSLGLGVTPLNGGGAVAARPGGGNGGWKV